jgi:hypothetical protein
VPERLAKFIGEDNGYLLQYVCSEPFKRFDIGPNGGVLVCCGHWLPTSIGNFLADPVEDVLNSGMAKKIRKSMTDGSYQYCNHLECGAMIQGTIPNRGELKDPAILKAIATDNYRVDRVRANPVCPRPDLQSLMPLMPPRTHYRKGIPVGR